MAMPVVHEEAPSRPRNKGSPWRIWLVAILYLMSKEGLSNVYNHTMLGPKKGDQRKAKINCVAYAQSLLKCSTIGLDQCQTSRTIKLFCLKVANDSLEY